MYLGRYQKTVAAVDNGSIRAVARGLRAKAVEQTPESPVLVDQSAEIAELRSQLAQARDMESHQRGRVFKLLDALRGKNRTIARLERELAARTGDVLTVEDVLSRESTSVN